MNILFITDLYPIKDSEKTTPRTLFDFVKEWKKQGNIKFSLIVQLVVPEFRYSI